ncbi:MAG: hypothetical protein KGZ25_06985 [Planctomycetes bacterium]|nr:hypothetical protein [Planctomycetota bacterium]
MYTPGFPAILAVTGKIFGMAHTLAASFLAYNAVVTLLGVGCIGLYYFVLRELEIPTGLFTTAFLFFAFSRTLYYYSVHIMTDVPFTFFALAALLFGLLTRRLRGGKSWGAFSVMALMILVASSIRPVGPLLALAITIGWWTRPKPLERWKLKAGQTGILWFLGGAALFCYSLWTRSMVSEGGFGYHYFRGMVTPDRFFRFFKILWTKLPLHLSGLSDTLMGTELGTTVGAILAFLILIGLIKSFRRGERELSFFTLLLGGVIIAIGWRLDRRYLLPATPVIFYWLALGLSATGEWLRSRWEFWTSSRLQILGYSCIGLVLLSNLVRIGDVILEQRGEFYSEIEHGKLANYEPVFAWLRENRTPENTVVAAREASTSYYFTRMKIKQLPHDSRGYTSEKVVRWLGDVDFVIEDKTEPKSTAALEELPRDGRMRFEEIDVGGAEQVQLLRVIAQDSSPEKEQENKR